MNYSEIIKELNNASLFDLYRLNVAIDVQLDDPKKLSLIKQQLEVGQEVSYFDAKENRLIDAIILKIRRTKVLLINKQDAVRWNIPFYMLNIYNVDTTIQATSNQQLDRNSLRIGDNVCFKNKQGKEVYGHVIKLNPKTAGIMVVDTKWRVHYSFLSLIIEGKLADKQDLLR